MSTQLRNTIAGVTAGFLVLFLAMPVAAFQGFDDGGGGGLPSCAGCHGSLANSGPGNAVHDAHASPANACSDCHNGSFNNPPLDDCVQCHGRNADAGVDNASAGTLWRPTMSMPLGGNSIPAMREYSAPWRSAM